MIRCNTRSQTKRVFHHKNSSILWKMLHLRIDEYNKLQEPCQVNTIPTYQPLPNAVFEFQIVNVQPTKNARRESNLMQHPSTFLRTFSGLVFSTGADESSRWGDISEWYDAPLLHPGIETWWTFMSKRINTEKKGEQREGGVGAKGKMKKEVARRSRLSKLNQQASYKLSQIACLSLNDRLHT